MGCCGGDGRGWRRGEGGLGKAGWRGMRGVGWCAARVLNRWRQRLERALLPTVAADRRDCGRGRAPCAVGTVAVLWRGAAGPPGWASGVGVLGCGREVLVFGL